MNGLVRMAVRLFIHILRLHPLAGVSDFYEEMQSTYTQVINESSGQGEKSLWQRIMRELFDLTGVILRSWIFGRKAMTENLSTPDRSSLPTPWGTALLSLLPFVLIGPVSLTLSYLPFWTDPLWTRWIWPGETILLALIVWGGIIMGAKRGFPRWSYTYVIGGVISLAVLVIAAFNNTPLHNQQVLGLLIAAAIFTAVTIRWHLFQPFWSHIRQDWTYLSYGLFAIIIMLSAGVDHDESPRLTFQVVLPSLLTLAGALVHLRAKTRLVRILALVVSLTLALPIWISPIFNGVVGPLSSRPDVLNLLFGGYFILLAILLAPALVGLIKRAEPEKETLK